MNIIEILSDHNIDHRTEGHEHCRAGWVQIDCPFCSPDTQRFRMGINLKYAYANCWHCGHKTLTYVLLKLLNLPVKNIKDIADKIRPEQIEQFTHTGKYLPPKNVTELLPPHKRYLQNRGFNIKKLKRLWSIQGIGLAARLQWHIFIPIIHHGQFVSWTTRSIADHPKNKYISAGSEEEAIPHKHLLYGEDYCHHSIVVVEGPADVWAGGPGFAAIFGLSYTNQQVKRISKYPVRAICFDNEPGAQQIARKLVNDLSAFHGETYNIILDSSDPGEATTYELRRIRKEILE